jgi:hypothetical protein
MMGGIMTMHGMRLFGFVLLSSVAVTGALAGAQTSAVRTKPAKAVSAADVAPAPVEAPPEFPKRPAELAPKPPKVTCHADQITISADNSALDAVLAAVRGCTGARVDIPQGAGSVRIYEELGPGPVRAMLDQLLSGTPYNYVIQSSDANPLKVEQVLISSRGSEPDKAAAPTNTISTDIPMTGGRRAWQRMQKFDKPDPNTVNADGTLAVSDAASPAEEAAAHASAAEANGAGTVEAASNSTPPSITPVAPPILDPSSGGDPTKAMQDRISAMQQMFSQRQQMMHKQNQGAGSTPNN